ncbi:MAG: histidine--tRNA ligase, partial [Candidatus Aenigmatarchaeota archaeon]
MAQFQPPRGTRDFLPQEMARRQFIFDTLRRVFERFGYQALETPAFESWELLAAKGAGGEDIKDEIYYFKDKSDRELGLKFDLTAPMARVLASRPELPKPFKRYQIQPVWRYEEIRAGKRYREFFQADVDVVGTNSMGAEAEILAITIEGLKALGFKDVYIKLNNRKVLEGLAQMAGIGSGKFLPMCRALDKVEKFGIKHVEDELKTVGIGKSSADKLFKLAGLKGTNQEILAKLRKELEKQDGIEELAQMLKLAEAYGIGKLIKIDPCLARGLDYYTGPIFEAVVKGKEAFGSVAGGGRYDKLIQLYGGPDTPATGISFGVERIFEIMEGAGMFKLPKSKTQVFLVAVNDEVRPKLLKIARELRDAGINTEIDLSGRGLSKQLTYINKAGVPWALIVGQRELKEKKFTLK